MLLFDVDVVVIVDEVVLVAEVEVTCCVVVATVVVTSVVCGSVVDVVVVFTFLRNPRDNDEDILPFSLGYPISAC